MTLSRQSFAAAVLLSALAPAAIITGCASPGPPRPPSLQLPAPVKHVACLRRGDTVELRFMLPHTTSDGVPLRSPTIIATACRGLAHEPCRPISESHTFNTPAAGATAEAELTDTLPANLTTGKPRLLIYRVQLANGHGKAAGYSDPAYTAAGAAPATVSALRAQGSRLGIVLTWAAAGADDSRVFLGRQDLNAATSQAAGHSQVQQQPVANMASPKHHAGSPAKPAPAKPKAVAASDTALLSTGESSGKPQGTATLDTTALTDEPYRYTAERRRTVELDGHSVELRSAVSVPVEYTLHDIYPPPAPTDVAVAGFTNAAGDGAQAKFAVDLIWQPVSDPDLAGYNVYRELLGASGTSADQVRLNTSPIALPGYHDDTANPESGYRYSVTSVDRRGNESAAATATLSPQSQ